MHGGLSLTADYVKQFEWDLTTGDILLLRRPSVCPNAKILTVHNSIDFLMRIAMYLCSGVASAGQRGPLQRSPI
jgi:hypothetical protein